ncbi:MAG: sensor domain-containing diguanylate cyclase, partial [bacterium]|nr:sensor domain-containing diguanylate cyclase [bacterium]
FDRITRVAQRLFHVPIASISFIDNQREWYKSKFGLYLKETPRNLSFGGYAILEKDIMIVKDVLHDSRFRDNPLVIGEPGIRFYLGCPLQIKGQFNVGILSLIDNKSKIINSTDLDIIKDLATNIEAEFDLTNQSTIDELTHLSNRHGLLVLGKQIIKRCNQFDKNVLVLYFDVSHLKKVNGNEGHDQGDKVLQIFAQQLLNNFRQTDAVARLGGDKFCVLCTGMSEQNVPNVLKRFRQKLSLIKSKNPIEFNANIVEYKRWKHHSIYSLVEEVDEKIYEDKRKFN